MKLPGLSDLTGQTMEQGQRRKKGYYLPWREVVTLKGLDTTSEFHSKPTIDIFAEVLCTKEEPHLISS